MTFLMWRWAWRTATECLTPIGLILTSSSKSFCAKKRDQVLTFVIPLVILTVINGGENMPNVKTAISIEKPIFEKMDILAKNLKISRSRLYSMAAQEFIERHKNLELLKALNQAYEGTPNSEPTVTQMRSRHYKLVKDQW